MNEPSHRLRQRTEEQSKVEQAAQHQHQAAREFASVEELIRHDAAAVEVPEVVTDRLKTTLTRESVLKPVPWWRRLLGG